MNKKKLHRSRSITIPEIRVIAEKFKSQYEKNSVARTPEWGEFM